MNKVEQQLSSGNLSNISNGTNSLQNITATPLNDYSFLKSSTAHNYEVQSQSLISLIPTANSSVSIVDFNFASNRNFTIRTEGTFTDNPGSDFDGNPLNPNDDVLIYAGLGFTINGNPTLPVIRDASGNPIRDSFGKQVLVENAIAVSAGYTVINAPNQQYSNLIPPQVVERQVIDVPIYEELKQQELNTRIPANTTTSTFNIQQNPINNAADWGRLFPNTGTQSNPTVIRITGGGLNIPSQVIQSNTVIIVEQGDINFNGSGHDFINVVLVANNGNINLNNIRSSNLSVLASGSINTNSEARFAGTSLLAAGSQTGTINFNGATTTTSESDKLQVISQGDITYNSTADTRGEFISGKNFTANSKSTIIGGIDAKGNIIFNGQVTVIGADTTDNVGNQAPEIFTQPETEYTVLRNSTSQITGIPLATTQPGLAEIQGQGFLDTNRNGARNSEPGIDGFVIELVNSVTGEVVAQQITRSVDLNGDGKINPFTEQGLYKFANLVSGSYEVREIGRDAWNPTSPFNIALASGEQKAGVHFANTQNYTYQVGATDLDGDALTYSLVSAPVAATIDATTGKLIWTPDATGEYTFKVKVADGIGGEDIQEFKLNVLDPNRLPSISSNPVDSATVGQNYTYQIIADNPDLDDLNFQLNQAPQGMSISPNGLIQWTPQANQVGAQQVRLLVKDDRGGEVEQVFTILTQGAPANPQPSGNYAPVITSNPVIAAAINQQYIYDVDAIDGDGDTLKYSLFNTPQGMIIDQNTGLISWNSGTQTAGNYSINVRVEDGKGGFDNQAFTLTLSNTVPGRISGIVWDDLNGNGVRDTSFAQGANPDVVFILDVSFSADDPFVGSPVGDLNGDRRANTILDAEIAGFIALNQQLISQGLGETARVSVIDFSGSAFSRDMVPNLAGRQLVTNPAADKDNNGILDVEQVLRGLQTGPFTNFEVALKEAENVFKTIGTTPGNGTLVFLSDGENTIGGAITDELNNLKALGVKSYAFGVGEGAKLNDGDRLADDLVLIDPNAKIFKNTDELLGTFNDLGGGENVVEPGLAGARVYLDLNNNAAFDVDEPNQITTTTGQYQFTGLLPNTYTVRQIVPNGYAQTFPTSTTSNLGSHTVNLGASEIVENRNFGNQNTTPKPNQLPNFISAPSTDAQIGKLFRYEATATDSDGDVLTYQLVTKPTGMAIDSERGVLIWQPAADQLGNFDVVLQVEDGKGGSATQSFQINVGDGVDRVLPEVNLGFSSNVVQIGESVTFNISATDNNGVENIALTIDGNPVALNAGSATVQLNKAGIFQVVATATDTVGNIVQKALSLRVTNPSDTTAPTVEIISPQNKTITNLTDIVGSVSDENLEFYRVDYAPLDLVDINNIVAADPDFVTISEGKTNVNNAVIGQFDPTVLFNGNYVLRVTAQDFSGNINSRGVFLGVSGDNKLGNFRLELTDLSIPLAGIPIQVNRVYDTLQSSFSGDFGFGWSLGVKDAKIQESVPVTEAEKQGVPSLFGANPFTAGTKVYLTNPEGRRVGFTFDPVVAGVSLLGTFWKPRFVADPGVYDKLEVDDINLQQRSDGSFGLFFIPFAYNPSEYKLTAKDGTTYDYDQFKGLQEIKDRNNNTLIFKDNGIFSSTGASVDFLRDTQGRITKITDPTGKAIVYGYDARGNLVSVTDQAGLVSRHTYLTNPNYLEQIIDPRGQAVIRTEYDERGRVKATKDALGNTISSDYNVSAGGSAVTQLDALGNTTTTVRDSRGNITSIINPLGAVARSTYDTNNNQISVTDPRGFTATRTFDTKGNVTSVTDALGNKRSFTYDQFNNVTSETDPLGRTTRFVYNANGNLTELIDATGQRNRFAYDNLGRVSSFTDANSNITTFGYSGTTLGKPTEVTFPDGSTQQIEYNQFGQISRLVDENGGATEYITDSIGRLVTKRDALGNETKYTYDAQLISSITDALGNVVKFEYDNAGRLIRQIDPFNAVTEFGYDDLGRLISETDPLLSTTTTTYRPDGLIAAITNPQNQKTSFDYDLAGNQTAVIDPLGNRTTFTYDALGRQISKTDSLTNTATYAYDAVNNLIQIIDRNNQKRTFSYDGVNRLVQENWVNNSTPVRAISLTYDAVGNLVKANDVDSTFTFNYDSRDRVTQVSQTGVSVAPITLNYTYDGTGNRTSVSDNLGVSVNSTYDARNLLTSQTWQGTGIDPARVNYTYDDRGARTQIQRFSNLAGTELVGSSTFNYDALQRLTGITHSSSAGSTLANYSYNYNLASFLNSETYKGQTTNYTYDRANQLTNTDRSVLPDENYTYDANGNRIGNSFVVGANNQILSDGQFNYTYDKEGNLATKTNIATGTLTTYNYDFRNRLIEVVDTNASGNATQSVEFKYDAFNRRISKTVNGQTTYFVNDGDNLWADLNQAGQVISRYLPGADVDELIACYRPGEGTSWYLTDRLGTIRDIANAVGNLANSIDYDSFGEILGQTNPSAGDRFTFAGREFDSETDLYYNRARYYDANLGRFISQDPIGFAGQDSNLYRYVGNNPVNASDSFGFIAALEYKSILNETVSGRTGSVTGSLIGFLQGFSATNLVFISNILDIVNAGGNPITEWGTAIARTEAKVKEIYSNLSRFEAVDNKEGLVKGFVSGAGYDIVKLEWNVFPDKLDRAAKALGPELSISGGFSPVSAKGAPLTKKPVNLSIKGGGFKQGYEAGLLYLEVIAAPN
jgi:RHS repeat-associated protein